MCLPLKFTLTPTKHFDKLKIQRIIAFTGMAFVIALISLLTNGIPETTITVNDFLAIFGALSIMTMLILKWLHEVKNSNSETPNLDFDSYITDIGEVMGSELLKAFSKIEEMRAAKQKEREEELKQAWARLSPKTDPDPTLDTESKLTTWWFHES